MVWMHCMPLLVLRGGRNYLQMVWQWPILPVQLCGAALQEILPEPPSTTAKKDFQDDVLLPGRAQWNTQWCSKELHTSVQSHV